MNDPKRTALLVIDMQVGLVDGAHDEERVIATIASLIERAREVGWQVVYVQHDHLRYEALMPGRPTWEIVSTLAPIDGEPVVHKQSSDAFYATDLESILVAADVGQVVVTGMQTEFCVDSTVRAASSRGFDVILVADGHTTGDTSLPAAQIIAHHNETLANLAQRDHPVRVVPARELLG